MRKINLLLLLIGIFSVTALTAQKEDFRSQKPKPGPAPRIDLGNFKQFTLKNGLQVIMVENHKLPRVSFQVFVDVPPIKEGDLAGTASMAGQLLNKGTATMSKAQIDEKVDFIGASLNTSASGIFGSCLTKHKETLLDLMADVLYNPSFPQEEFDKLKKQTLSGLAQAKEDPNAIAGNVAQVVRYGKDHPYGEIETEETVGNLTLEGCKQYYNTYFKPNASYLIVVGDITEKETKAISEKYFARWKRGVVPKEEFPVAEKPGEVAVDFVNRSGAVQSVINVTYPIDLKPGSADAISTSLLNTILGSGFSGRLFQNLREDKGYTYGAYSTISTDELVGYFNASASVRNEVTDSSVTQFLYEMDRLLTEKISEDEIQLAKNKIFGSFARSMERPETIARFALNTARYNLPGDYYATYLEKLEKIDANKLMETSKKYISPKDAHILVVGNKAEVAEKLESFATSGKINYLDALGNPVKDEGMSVPDGTTAETVIADYVSAIGGADNLKKVKDVAIVMGASAQGMTLELQIKNKAPNKLLMITSMGGNPMSTTKYDGENAAVMQMGQNLPVDDETKAGLEKQAMMFPEMSYARLGYQLELLGIEDVDGKKAYAISVTSPEGDKSTEYYDMSSSLKIRNLSTQKGPQGDVTVTTDFGDYKEVNGVKFPHKTTITGMAPFPLSFEVTTLQVNGGIDDSEFAIE